VKSARTVEVRPTILVDYAAAGEPIGIELTAPTNVDADLVNTVLGEIGRRARATRSQHRIGRRGELADSAA
jgi:hypothetical protein